MKDTPEIAAARIEAARARERLLASFQSFEAPVLDLKQQLTPSHIMSDAWQAAKNKGADMAEDAVDAVRARPLAASGVVAAITLFLAREPLMDLAAKVAHSFKSKRTAKKPAKTPRKTTKSKANTEAPDDRQK